MTKSNVDYRVVEMRFDNKQFEANAKVTMGTLSKLKESLKFTDGTKAFENIDKAAKNIKLDGIASGVETLAKRFSFLGETVRKISTDVRDSLMNAIAKPIQYVEDAIVSGGIKRAMNIENAHFQLQALLKDETKVQAVMADAMESVDGTAYAYDEAAKAASQFAASGIQAGEDMLGALKGITGVAAMTNSSFEDISRIFTTVAGNGRLMGDQLLQLSGRGLNAASTLADYFREVRGQAGMTEATIREMVSDGQISFRDFSDAMTWAFGDSAKRANETFTGAMSNMRSALARIGAGFISPLVEQNGELVQLFNALRIKINDVKSALVFDEQRSAVAGLSDNAELFYDTMTQIVKDGSVGFEEITTAILGSSKSEEELNKINDKLVKAFEEVKESGSASSETLFLFRKNGINAFSSLENYINGVLDGTIKVSEATKDSIKELTGNVPVGIKAVNDLAEEGKISFDLFAEAITYTSGVVEKETKYTSDTIKNMMADVKSAGSVTSDALKEFNRQGMNGYTALRDYMNGVTEGTVRASYATKQAIEEITEGTSVGIADIERFAKEGKINFDIFQSAMENAYGTEKTLSKQFTDTFQDMIKAVYTAINEYDVTDLMDVFYYSVESVKNVVKGLYSVLKPIGKAFADVFLNFDSEDVISFAEAIERLTSKMKISDRTSQNLHDAFKGMFDIVKLLVDVFFDLLGAVVPINKPVLELGGNFTDLLGYIGKGLSSFTKMIRSSTKLKKAFGLLSSGISAGAKAISAMIRNGRDFVETVYGLDIVQNVLGNISKVFKEFTDKIDFDNVAASFDSFKKRFEALGDTLMKNDGLRAFVQNAKEYAKELKKAFTWDNFVEKIKGIADFFSKDGVAGDIAKFIKESLTPVMTDLKEAFTWDSIMDRIEKIMSVFGKFFNWIKNNFAPAFKDFNAGSAIASGTGVGIVYSLIKMSKAFENISKAFSGFGKIGSSVSDFLKVAGSTLKTYQKDLKANILLKIAGAITLLAVSLVLLSFTDTDRLLKGAEALALVSGVLLLGVTLLLKAINEGNSVNKVGTVFAKGLSKTMKQIGKAIKMKAFGSAVKSFATAMLEIVGSIIALALMYKNDPDAFVFALKTIMGISMALVAITGLMALGSKITNTKGMKDISNAILTIVLSFGATIFALSKLMNMKLPAQNEVEKRLFILGVIFGSFAALSVVLALAAKIAGKNSLPNMSKAFSGLAIMLVATVLSLKVLFNMALPPEDEFVKKIGVLIGIFGAMAVLVLAIGAAAKMSGGNPLKAAGTILALAAFLGVTVGALYVLTLLPTEKMLYGAIGLGIVFAALGVALYGAGKISDKSTWKAILAMALTIGVVTAALAVLTLLKWQKLVLAVGSLSVVFLVLSKTFKEASKMNFKSAISALLLIAVSTAAVGYALYQLAKQPWKNMLAGAVAMSLTIAAFAKSFQMILKPNWSKNAPKKIGTFLLMTLSVITLGGALYLLADRPWEGMVGGAIGLAVAIVAFAKAYELALKPNWSANAPKKIGTFLLMTLSVITLGAALYLLADRPWEGMISAAASLGVAVLAFAKAYEIALKPNWSKNAPKKIGTFLLMTLSVITLGTAIGLLAKQPWDGMIGAAVALGIAVNAMASAFWIISKAKSMKYDHIVQFILSTVACLSLAFTLKKMDGIKNGIVSAISLGIAVNALAAAFLIMSKAKSMDYSAIVQFIASSIACIPLAFALSMMSGIENGIQAGIALGIVTVALSTAFLIMSNAKGVNIGGIIAFIAASIACIPLAFALSMMSGIENGLEAAVALGIAANAIAVALLIMGSVGPQVLVGALAFVLAAVACIPLAYVINTLSGLSWEEVAKGLIALAGGLVIMGVAAAVFGTFIVPMLLGSVALIAFSAAVAIAGLAIVSFVSNVYTALNIGEMIIYKLMDMTTKFFEIGVNVIKGLIEGLVSGFKSVIDTVSDIATSVIDKVKSIFKTHSPSEEMKDIGENVDKGFEIGVDNGRDDMMDTVNDVFGDVTDAIDVDKYTNAGEEAIESFGTGFDAEGMANSMISGLSGVADSIDYSSFTSMGEGASGSFMEGLGLDENLTSMFGGLGEGIDLSSFANMGEGAMGEFLGGFSLDGDMGSMLGNLTSGIDLSSFTSLGGDASGNLLSAFTSFGQSEKADVVGLSKNMSDAITGGFDDNLKESDYKEMGNNLVSWIDEGCNESFALFIKDIKKLCTSIANSFKDNLDSKTFETIGKNIALGLKKGMEDKDAVDSLVNAAKKIAKATADASAKELDEHSPSKVAGKIGEFFTQGMANGILSNIKAVMQAGAEVSDEAINPIATAADIISDILGSDDYNFNPVIRPVVDLTDVQNSVLDIQRAFNESVSITAMNAQGTAMSFDTARRVVDDQKTSNNESRLKDYIDSTIDNKMQSINVNVDSKVTLQGTAKDVFKLVKQENDWYIENKHYNPLASRK